MKPEERILQLLEEGVLAVDAEGRVWRRAYLSHGELRWLVEPRRIDRDDGRYRSVYFAHEGRNANVKAHRVVWIAAHGLIPDGVEINHEDSDKQNNRLSNLTAVTPSENVQHAYDHGTRRRPWADQTRPWRGKQRVSAAMVDDMVRLRADGLTLAEIAAEVGCSTSHAFRLLKRRTSKEEP